MAKSKYIKNIDKLGRRLSDPEWIAKPAGELLRVWQEDVRAYAEEHAPKWQNRTADSIRTQTDSAKFPLFARVFSEEPQARWMEYGTGLLSEDPESKHERHYVPIEAITPWAEDHGLVPYLVARGIAERGGLAPRHFFRDAEAHADAQLNKWMGEFSTAVQHEASS